MYGDRLAKFLLWLEHLSSLCDAVVRFGLQWEAHRACSEPHKTRACTPRRPRALQARFYHRSCRPDLLFATGKCFSMPCDGHVHVARLR
jgi:hypothetical protein